MLLLLICVISVTSDIVPEFQFPCYVDVCTFPRQYCNSDRNERRCSPCTRSLCKEKELPRACLYFCQVADKPKTTTSSPLVTAAVQNQWQDNSSVYMVYMIVFIAITNTAIFATVIFYVLWTIHHRRKRRTPLSLPLERFISEGNEKRGNEEPLLPKKKPTRQVQCEPELELRRLESWQSLPPYCTRDMIVVDVPERSTKRTDSLASETDNQSTSLNNSKKSIDVPLQGFKSSEFAKFVSSPTRDNRSECHEKPWKLGTETEKQFDNTEPTLRSETDVEETSLKQ